MIGFAFLNLALYNKIPAQFNHNIPYFDEFQRNCRIFEQDISKFRNKKPTRRLPTRPCSVGYRMNLKNPIMLGIKE